MKNKSLLAHLVTNFTAHPEDLATRSLQYILSKSIIAKSSFINFINGSGTKLPNNLTFSLFNKADDNTIPDLIGLDELSRERILIESKFWAGLTDNQPLGYLKRLVEDDSILLFIVPSKRMHLLWGTLLKICNEDESWKFPSDGEDLNYLKIARFINKKIMLITNWENLLSAIRISLVNINEIETISNLDQLSSLCKEMDKSEYLPLTKDDLNSYNGIRIIKYSEIIDKVINQLESKKIISKLGRYSGGVNYFGCTIYLNDFNFYFHFNAYNWADFAETPLWLQFWTNGYCLPNPPALLISKLKSENPARYFDVDGKHWIALYPLINSEIDEVVDNIIEQIKKISSYL